MVIFVQIDFFVMNVVLYLFVITKCSRKIPCCSRVFVRSCLFMCRSYMIYENSAIVSEYEHLGVTQIAQHKTCTRHTNTMCAHMGHGAHQTKESIHVFLGERAFCVQVFNNHILILKIGILLKYTFLKREHVPFINAHLLVYIVFGAICSIFFISSVV